MYFEEKYILQTNFFSGCGKNLRPGIRPNSDFFLQIKEASSCSIWLYSIWNCCGITLSEDIQVFQVLSSGQDLDFLPCVSSSQHDFRQCSIVVLQELPGANIFSIKSFVSALKTFSLFTFEECMLRSVMKITIPTELTWKHRYLIHFYMFLNYLQSQDFVQVSRPDRCSIICKCLYQ